MKKKIISLLLIVILCISLLPVNDSFAKKKIKLNKKEIEIDVGETFQLVLKNAKAKKVKWSSDDKDVATVNSKGVVKGISDGFATITAEYKGKKYKCEADVTEQNNEINTDSFFVKENNLFYAGLNRFYIVFSDVKIDANKTSFTVKYTAKITQVIGEYPYEVKCRYEYSLCDDDGYVVKSGTFDLPSGYVGDKVKATFDIDYKLKSNTEYELLIKKQKLL